MIESPVDSSSFVASLAVRHDGKPKLSWSAIDALLTCHHQFTLRFVHQTKTPEVFAWPLFEGQILHSGMARWWKLPLSKKRDGALMRSITQAFDEEVANTKIVLSSVGRVEALRKVLQAGENVLEVIKRERLLGKVRGMEAEFACAFEDFYITGRYDLLLETMDGDLTLVDYKYSTNARYGHRYQLITQAIGVKSEYGELPAVAGFLYCKGDVQRFRTIHLDEYEVAKFGDKLGVVWSDYEQSPYDRNFVAYKCDWCTVRERCDDYIGANPTPRRTLEEHGHGTRIEL